MEDKELFLRHRNYPLEFLRDKFDDVFDINEDVFNYIHSNDSIIRVIMKSDKIGVTEAILRYFIWFIQYHGYKRINIVGKDVQSGRQILKRFKELFENIKPYKNDILNYVKIIKSDAYRIQFSNDSSIGLISENFNYSCVTDCNILFFDEFASHEKSVEHYYGNFPNALMKKIKTIVASSINDSTPNIFNDIIKFDTIIKEKPPLDLLKDSDKWLNPINHKISGSGVIIKLYNGATLINCRTKQVINKSSFPNLDKISDKNIFFDDFLIIDEMNLDHLVEKQL